MSKIFEAHWRIYRRDDNICDICGEKIEKGEAWIIDRQQCHLVCYNKKIN